MAEDFPSVIVVMLRQPKSHANESRTDPYWEFGSFGSTGCHHRSVMSRGRIKELEGKRFAFAQGGHLGFRLVHVTPPLSARYLKQLDVCEARWTPADMPLRYSQAPCLIDNAGESDFPSLIQSFSNVRRHTWVAKFASAFRTSRSPLAGIVGAELLHVYGEWRKARPDAVANAYIDALPFLPPRIDSIATRRQNYDDIMKQNDLKTVKRGRCRTQS